MFKQKRPFLNLTLSLVACTLWPISRVAANPPEFIGVVEQVVDGDTIYVRDPSGKLQHVRINWIDAPDLGQKWSKESRDALKKQIIDKNVRVVPHREEDPLPCDVYVGEIFLSKQRLQDGWAWNYLPYSRDKELIAAEAESKSSETWHVAGRPFAVALGVACEKGGRCRSASESHG